MTLPLPDSRQSAVRGMALPFFQLRTPLLPIDVLESVTVPKGRVTNEQYTEIRNAELTEVLGRLSRDDVWCSLHSSQGVRVTLTPFRQFTGNRAQPPPPKVERLMIRTLMRLCTRATPYGLFAAISVGEVGSSTKLRLPIASTDRVVCELDSEVLDCLVDSVETQTTSLGTAVFRTNPSVFKSATHLTYLERAQGRRGHSVRELSVEERDDLYHIIHLARDGISVREIVQALTKDFGFDEDSAVAFVDELVSTNLLVSALRPPLVGSRPTSLLVNSLVDATEGDNELSRQLLRLDRLLNQAEEAKELDAKLDRLLDRANQVVESLTPNHDGETFALTLNRRLEERVVSADLRTNLIEAVSVLDRCYDPVPESPFAELASAFVDRFGDQIIPLQECLDSTLGLGNHALRDPDSGLEGVLARRNNSEFRPEVISKLWEGVQSGEDDIFLEDEDLPSQVPQSNITPETESYAIHATLFHTKKEPPSVGAILNAAAGPNGTRFFSRFCHADPELSSRVAGFLRAIDGDRQEPLYFDIVFESSGRQKNIAWRPDFDRHGLEILGTTSNSHRRLALDDLFITFRGTEPLLWSASLGRRLRPRLNTAERALAGHNPALYRFLALIEATDGFQLSWNWGSFQGARFLPRVWHSGILLSRARWNFKVPESSLSSGVQFYTYMQEIREKFQLPRFVRHLQPGQEDPRIVDLDNIICVEDLGHSTKRAKNLVLQEMLPPSTASVPLQPGGSYVSDVVLPVKVAPSHVSEHKSCDTQKPYRMRPVVASAHCLYVKLYRNRAAGKLVLDRFVKVIAESIEGRGLARHWFFLNYSDPSPHVRLRVFDAVGLSTLIDEISSVAQDCIDEGIAWRLQFDTYQREVGRYGGQRGVESIEPVFHLDSLAALEILQATTHSGNRLSNLGRWLSANWLNRVLSMLGFSLESRRITVAEICERLRSSGRISSDVVREVANWYRQTREPRESFLASLPQVLPPRLRNEGDLTSKLQEALALHMRVSRKIDGRRNKIILAQNLVHMHSFRVAYVFPELEEFAVSDALRRSYLRKTSPKR